MIDAEQIEMESQLAILHFRQNAIPCHKCKKPPQHEYQPGARTIWCCTKSVTDSRLKEGFADWNSLQNSLAARSKKP